MAVDEPEKNSSTTEESSTNLPTNEKTGSESSDISHHDEVSITTPRLVALTVGMMTVVFLMALDHYILATATPQITTDFNSLQDAAWYSSGYFLTNMALQPCFGQLYGVFSIKLLYLVCLVIFEIGSIICAVAPSSAVLILGRVIAGVGGGGLYVGSLVLTGHSVPIQKRAIYISVVTSLDGAASCAGPLLGGVFTDSSLTWRFCFWINLPLGFMAFLIFAFFVRDPPQQGQNPDGTSSSKWTRLLKIDWLSPALLLGGFSLLLLAMEWAGPIYPWSNAHVLATLITSLVILGCYLLYQHYRGEDAAIPYRLLKQRTVFASSGFMLLIAMIIGALTYYLPFYFQAVLGSSAEQSGIQNLSFLMSVMLFPILAGLMINAWRHYVPFMWLGSIFATVGCGLLMTLNSTTNQSRQIAFQFLAGFGVGISHQVPFTSVQNVLPPDDMIIGTALCSFLNSLGTILGILGAQAIFAGLLTEHLSSLVGPNARDVILAGPNNIVAAVPDRLVPAVRGAYSESLQGMFIFPTVVGGLCLACSLLTEWKQVKTDRPKA